jgi:hypothetical protein
MKLSLECGKWPVDVCSWPGRAVRHPTRPKVPTDNRSRTPNPFKKVCFLNIIGLVLSHMDLDLRIAHHLVPLGPTDTREPIAGCRHHRYGLQVSNSIIAHYVLITQ